MYQIMSPSTKFTCTYFETKLSEIFCFCVYANAQFQRRAKSTDQVLVYSLWTIFDNETAINKIKNMNKRSITTFYFCALYMIS